MKEITIAKRAARAAGDVLLSHIGRLKDVRYKSRRDPVSEADRESEALVMRMLADAFPMHGFMGEEGASRESVSGGRWIVDPLDGTVNFAHGLPAFCVSIAFERDGEVVAGVVFDPMRREMFVAERGGGASLNNKPIHVSRTDSLAMSLLATGFPYDLDDMADEVLGAFGKMALASQGIRRFGSAALDLCWLAAGRFDGFWELNLKPWDTAAGMLIVREAGGAVTDFSGGEYRPGMRETLACNGLIHGEMVGVLKGVRG